MPNAQCPMPHAPCPIPNPQIPNSKKIIKKLSKVDIIFSKKRYNQDLLKLRQLAASRAVTHANNTAINS
ncbi:MAG: hypothetical protein AAFR37_11040, partial [Cyanobacteria bacterium J06628_3]